MSEFILFVKLKTSQKVSNQGSQRSVKSVKSGNYQGI